MGQRGGPWLQRPCRAAGLTCPTPSAAFLGSFAWKLSEIKDPDDIEFTVPFVWRHMDSPVFETLGFLPLLPRSLGTAHHCTFFCYVYANLTQTLAGEIKG